MGNVDQNQIQILGPTLQALGGALSSECIAGKTQSTFDMSGYIVEDLNSLDIVPPLIFKSVPDFSFGSITINSSRNIQSGLILNSGGVYPPEILQSVNKPRSAFRWSTGQVCFSLYASNVDTQEVSLFFEKGPDFGVDNPWLVLQDKRIIASRSNKGVISFEVSPKVGWNTIQVQQPGCYSHKKSPRQRWNLRADDRGLCIQISRILINQN